jgi:hypothetical protein
MRILTVLIFLATFSWACQSGNKPDAGPDAPSRIEGYWINEAWWQLLQATRSPRQAAEKGEIAGITVRQDSGQWVALFNYNWHEGMGYLVPPGQGGRFPLAAMYEGDESPLPTLVLTPEGKLTLDSFTFIRLGDADTGYNKIRAATLAGAYALPDGTPVQFQEDGALSGLPGGYQSYDLLNDYIMDEVGENQLMLFKQPDEPEFFAYRFNGAKLEIFTITASSVDPEAMPTYALGELAFELMKK